MDINYDALRKELQNSIDAFANNDWGEYDLKPWVIGHALSVASGHNALEWLKAKAGERIDMSTVESEDEKLVREARERYNKALDLFWKGDPDDPKYHQIVFAGQDVPDLCDLAERQAKENAKLRADAVTAPTCAQCGAACEWINSNGLGVGWFCNETKCGNMEPMGRSAPPAIAAIVDKMHAEVERLRAENARLAPIVEAVRSYMEADGSMGGIIDAYVNYSADDSTKGADK